jgi:hypothetical protein
MQTCTVTGMVRNVGDMTVGVTETSDSAHFLNICPRVVHVRPGNTFSKELVRICNLNVRPVVIYPISAFVT